MSSRIRSSRLRGESAKSTDYSSIDIGLYIKNTDPIAYDLHIECNTRGIDHNESNNVKLLLVKLKNFDCEAFNEEESTSIAEAIESSKSVSSASNEEPTDTSALIYSPVKNMTPPANIEAGDEDTVPSAPPPVYGEQKNASRNPVAKATAQQLRPAPKRKREDGDDLKPAGKTPKKVKVFANSMPTIDYTPKAPLTQKKHGEDENDSESSEPSPERVKVFGRLAGMRSAKLNHIDKPKKGDNQTRKVASEVSKKQKTAEMKTSPHAKEPRSPLQKRKRQDDEINESPLPQSKKNKPSSQSIAPTRLERPKATTKARKALQAKPSERTNLGSVQPDLNWRPELAPLNANKKIQEKADSQPSKRRVTYEEWCGDTAGNLRGIYRQIGPATFIPRLPNPVRLESKEQSGLDERGEQNSLKPNGKLQSAGKSETPRKPKPGILTLEALLEQAKAHGPRPYTVTRTVKKKPQEQ